MTRFLYLTDHLNGVRRTPRGKFPRVKFPRGKFPRVNFPRGEFP